MISNTKFIFFILIAIGCVLEVVGDVLLKKWTISNKNFIILLGLGFYFLGSIFWAFSLKYEYLSKAISVFFILNVMFIVLIGVFFFKENLTLFAKIGIVLGIISIALIEFW